MATSTTRFALSKPASGDNVSAFQGTIGTTLDTVDADMIGLQGAYAGGTTYHQGDVVTSGGVYYMSTTTQTGTAPPGATWLPWNTGTGHYATYTFSYSLANTSQVNPTGAVWTSVSDTDNYGTTLSASGKFTIPAGLGGLYVVTGGAFYPAASYTTVSSLLTDLSTASAANAGMQLQATFANAVQIHNASWTGAMAAAATVGLTLLQTSGSSRTVTGFLSIARIGVS